VTEPTWYTGHGGPQLRSLGRSLDRFASSAEQAILTSRRGESGLSGGSSGGGLGGGGGGTF
jgi:uncharacterized membrane protein